MDWIETPDSSNITRFAYDNAASVLFIEFNTGGEYQYFDVPESVFNGMRAADSKGQYFAQNIKGVYRYARV
jgi:hypothetical protein